MSTIAIANHKGGCGKTITAINLAACLAVRRKAVLLVDLDPQAHATVGLGINPATLDQSMYDVLSDFTDERATIDEVIIQADDFLSLAPSAVVLSAIEQERAKTLGRENRLREALELVSDLFDYIIIDSPPNVGILTFNALKASEMVIVPIDPSPFSLYGIDKLMELLMVLKEKTHHHVAVRVLLTLYDQRSKYARAARAQLEARFGPALFKSAIRRTVSLVRAADEGVPVSQFDRNSGGFADYMLLAEELMTAPVPAEAEVLEFGDFLSILRGQEQLVTFSLTAPEASSVQLVGDFNDWTTQPALVMTPTGDGMWSVAVPLSPGKYEYLFLVDGQWTLDWTNPDQVTTNIGSCNSVMEVG